MRVDVDVVRGVASMPCMFGLNVSLRQRDKAGRVGLSD